MLDKKINSIMPSLCELDEFSNLLKESWASGILTHNGPLLKKLEIEICNTLDVNNYIAVSNCTLALQLSIEALNIKGTILVPAFSWIATASAVSWQNCKIKFCDIDPKTLNICTNSIEQNIDASVEAIMPVHVFGNPCNVKELNNISKKYKLKLIYDAAHAFGTTLEGESILSQGDISCVSTHATKIFNTGEGGGIISNNEKLNKEIKALRFFGFDDNKEVVRNGINAKMSELHAALGIANLRNFNNTLNHRKRVNEIYRNELDKCKDLTFQKIDKGSNCSYFPVILDDRKACMKLIDILSKNNIYPRRYFHPSLNKIKAISTSQKCPNSESISERILCLPSHNKVSLDDTRFISNIIKNIYS